MPRFEGISVEAGVDRDILSHLKMSLGKRPELLLRPVGVLDGMNINLRHLGPRQSARVGETEADLEASGIFSAGCENQIRIFECRVGETVSEREARADARVIEIAVSDVNVLRDNQLNVIYRQAWAGEPLCKLL